MGSRAFVWTINNPTEDVEEFKQRLVDVQYHRYSIWQLEQGESATPHWQGYSEFTRPIRCGRWCTTLGNRAHVESRRGTRVQARDYCRKEEGRLNGPWEVGTWTAGGSGTRNDLSICVESLQQGKRLSSVALENPSTWVKYHRGLTSLANYIDQPRYRPHISIVLLVGPTGTGKTLWCWNSYPEAWLSNSSLQWFNGYEGQDVCVLDEFCGSASHIALSFLLRLLDCYPLRVPTKGGFVPWNPLVILLTTNLHPAEWYDYSNRREQYMALKRRFTAVYKVEEIGSMNEVNKDIYF